MFSTARKTLTTVAAFGALALGGAAFANAAATNPASPTQASASSSQAFAAAPPAGRAPGGRHMGANGKQEAALTGDTAAKVKAAAVAKVSGGTVERVETDVDHGSPYEAHVRKADGTELEVLVNSDFEVTAVNSMMR